MRTLLELTMPLESGLMTTARLATGGVCSLAGLDLDTSEDCKVCLTESLLLLMHRGFSAVRVRFFEDEGLLVRAAGTGEIREAGEYPEDEISFALLGALNGSVTTAKKGGKLAEISFRFAK